MTTSALISSSLFPYQQFFVYNITLIAPGSSTAYKGVFALMTKSFRFLRFMSGCMVVNSSADLEITDIYLKLLTATFIFHFTPVKLQKGNPLWGSLEN